MSKNIIIEPSKAAASALSWQQLILAPGILSEGIGNGVDGGGVGVGVRGVVVRCLGDWGGVLVLRLRLK